MAIHANVWLPCNHQVHGREQFLFSTRDKTIRSLRQTIRRLLCSFGNDASRFECTKDLVYYASADMGHAQNCEKIKGSAQVLQLSAQRPVPWCRILSIRKILVKQVFVVRILGRPRSTLFSYTTLFRWRGRPRR